MRGRLARMLTVAMLASGCPSSSSSDAGDTGDAGPVDAGADAGAAAAGALSGPCHDDNTCDGADLTCVASGAGATCRRLCAPDDPNDPCGPGVTCRPLTGLEGGACMPAGELDDACPCDEGFRCIASGDGARCRPECVIVDGGPGACPPGTGACLPIVTGADAGPTGEGACVE